MQSWVGVDTDEKHALQCNDPDRYEESILRQLAAPTLAPVPLAVSSIAIQCFNKKRNPFDDQHTDSQSRLKMAERKLRSSPENICLNNVKLSAAANSNKQVLVNIS